MAALTGTIVKAAAAGEIGRDFTVLLKYDLAAALASADTITWTNALPNAKRQILDVEVWYPTLDTNATPTHGVKIGDGTTTDAYLLAKVQKVLPQIFYKGDGTSISTSFSGLRDIVLTCTANAATTVTSGTIWVRVRGVVAS